MLQEFLETYKYLTLNFWWPWHDLLM